MLFNFILYINKGIISKIIMAPQAANPILALKCSANNPAYRLPKGVDPAKTKVYTLITLPRYSLFELSCKVEFALEVKEMKMNPVIARNIPVNK